VWVYLLGCRATGKRVAESEALRRRKFDACRGVLTARACGQQRALLVPRTAKQLT